MNFKIFVLKKFLFYKASRLDPFFRLSLRGWSLENDMEDADINEKKANL